MAKILIDQLFFKCIYQYNNKPVVLETTHYFKHWPYVTVITFKYWNIWARSESCWIHYCVAPSTHGKAVEYTIVLHLVHKGKLGLNKPTCRTYLCHHEFGIVSHSKAYTKIEALGDGFRRHQKRYTISSVTIVYCINTSRYLFVRVTWLAM